MLVVRTKFKGHNKSVAAKRASHTTSEKEDNEFLMTSADFASDSDQADQLYPFVREEGRGKEGKGVIEFDLGQQNGKAERKQVTNNARYEIGCDFFIEV